MCSCPVLVAITGTNGVRQSEPSVMSSCTVRVLLSTNEFSADRGMILSLSITLETRAGFHSLMPCERCCAALRTSIRYVSTFPCPWLSSKPDCILVYFAPAKSPHASLIQHSIRLDHFRFLQHFVGLVTTSTNKAPQRSLC